MAHWTAPPIPSSAEHRRDHVLVTIWFIVSFRQFPFDELILYPLALYFAWAFIRDFPLIFPVVARSLILFAFPTWWFLSALWGEQPVLILKSGFQLLLTILICYSIATRLSARDVIISLLIAAGIYGVWSFIIALDGSSIAARGVFASKNAMGAAMVVLWLSALCIASDAESTRRLRVLAMIAACLAGWQIYISNSATAVLLALGVALLVFLLGILPRSGILRRVEFYILLLLVLGLGMIGWATFSATQEINPIDLVLNAFGKDTTLTGRTVLWEYATVQIRQEPLLGVGHGGFWTPLDGLSEASRIHTEFHKGKYDNFSFHNSYYDIAVHQGLIGLGVVVAATLWIVVGIFRSFQNTNRISVVFFICVMAITLSRSMTETGLLGAFSLMSMLFIVGALIPLRRAPDNR
jgi:exopolysaccharide production protein ExoQ